MVEHRAVHAGGRGFEPGRISTQITHYIYSREVGDGVPYAVAVLFSSAEVCGLTERATSQKDFAEFWNM